MIIRLVIILLILFAVFTVALFFGLRRYIVYTPDGLRLEIPWLEADNSEQLTDNR